MHVMMKILKQNDTQSAIAHHSTATHEDGKEEVEKPLVSYCKEIVGFESRCFYNLGSRHEAPTQRRETAEELRRRN